MGDPRGWCYSDGQGSDCGHGGTAYSSMTAGAVGAICIYDYMLGGSHNFEADRAAAERLRSMVPSVQNVMRLNRWFMHSIVDRLAAEGLRLEFSRLF